MGLDMYLEGKLYIGGSFNEIDEDITIRVKEKWAKQEKVFKINSKDIDDVIIPLGYWRKANSIHRWFVKNCFDGDYDDYSGEDIYVEKEQLIELKNLCTNVLDRLKFAKTFQEKKEIIEKFLPMQNGFFFGYNDGEEGIEWYKEDMENTIKILDEALNKIKKYNLYTICYNASW